MATLTDLRKRLRGVQTICQLAGAMRTVSSAKLAEENPEGTNTIINAELDNRWVPSTLKDVRRFFSDEIEPRGAAAAGERGK